jgi:hypothetical protein
LKNNDNKEKNEKAKKNDNKWVWFICYIFMYIINKDVIFVNYIYIFVVFLWII